MIPDRFQYFLDDSGNYEHFVKIWTRRPPNYYQHALTNTRKYGIILDKYYLCQSGTQQNRTNRETVCPRYHVFIFLWVFFCENEYIVSKELCWDENRKMIHFPFIKSTKAWMRISYLSKNMKWKCGNFSIFR